MNNLSFRLNVIKYRRLDSFYRWLAGRLPRQLVYWAAIRLIAHAVTGIYGDTAIPDLRAMEALNRWLWHDKYDIPEEQRADAVHRIRQKH